MRRVPLSRRRARPASRGARLGLVLLLAATTGCTAATGTTPVARDGRSGLQGAGTFQGRQIAVATGLPQLLVGDCDPIDGPDADVCVIAETIDGRTVVLTFENPAALTDGAILPVEDRACEQASCDDVTDVAIVSLKLDTGRPVRAVDGTVRVRRVVPNLNYAAELSLALADGGAFSGQMDVVPRPE